MSIFNDLHNQAMDLAEEAFVLRLRGGDAAEVDRLTKIAFEYERRAADAARTATEPMRSVIHRSAAVLALECDELRPAERLIATALSGDPPDDIAEELRNLLERVHFKRHLSLRGIALTEEEFQVSFAGQAIGLGIAQSAEALGRIETLQQVVYRTLERRIHQPYRDRGAPTKDIRGMVFVTTPRAASFAVSLRVGKFHQIALPGLSVGGYAIDDIMTGADLIMRGDDVALSDLIPNEAYRRNFVGLMKKIAPDGERITLVGLTAIRDGIERTVQLTRTKNEFASEPTIRLVEASRRVRIVGDLRYADSRQIAEGRIKLVDTEGRQHTIVVPEGLMSDIVKPLWEDRVIVTGSREGRFLRLENIERAEESPASESLSE